MAFGLASIVTCCVPLISCIFALIAIVLGGVATTRGHQLPAARAGVKLGILGFFLMLLFGFALAGLIMDLLP
jgi:hypothetical protein